MATARKRALSAMRRRWITIPTGGQNARNLDLALCVDLTKSMQPFITAAQKRFDQIIKDILSEQIHLRLGIIGYRDWYPPELNPNDDKPRVFDIHDFTSDTHKMGQMVNSLQESPVGNSDVTEAVLTGLRASCEELEWRAASKKVLILVGDAPPHGCGGKEVLLKSDPLGFKTRGRKFNRGDNYSDGDPCGR